MRPPQITVRVSDGDTVSVVNAVNISVEMSDAVEWWPLLAGLFGGLGLFLLGVQRLTLALKAMAGDNLRRILARLTTNRIAAAATGVGLTAIV